MHNYSEYGIYNVNQWTLLTLKQIRSYNTQNAIRPFYQCVRHLRPKISKPPSVVNS